MYQEERNAQLCQILPIGQGERTGHRTNQQGSQ